MTRVMPVFAKWTTLLMLSVVLLFVGSCSVLLGVGFWFPIGEPNSTMTPSTALCTIFLGVPFLVGGAVLFRTTRSILQRNR